MKSLLAASIAFFLCTPVYAHHGPYGKSEDGKYHFMHLRGLTSTPTSGESAAYSVKSVDNKAISFTRFDTDTWGYTKDSADTKDNFSIALDELLSYGLASQSTSSNFNNINAAGVRAAAVLMAAPIMLPWALLSSGGQTTSATYILSYVDDHARVQQRVLLITGKEASFLNEFLTSNLDLKPGQQPLASTIRKHQKFKLAVMESKLDAVIKPLLVTTKSKPWCTRIDLSGSSGDPSKYQSLLNSIQVIRESLEMEPLATKAGASSDAEFEKYLDNAPHLRTWAEANPAAAAKFKYCPLS